MSQVYTSVAYFPRKRLWHCYSIVSAGMRKRCTCGGSFGGCRRGVTISLTQRGTLKNTPNSSRLRLIRSSCTICPARKSPLFPGTRRVLIISRLMRLTRCTENRTAQVLKDLTVY